MQFSSLRRARRHVAVTTLVALGALGAGTADAATSATTPSTKPATRQTASSCSGQFTAQILSGPLAPLALHGRLVVTNGKSGQEIGGYVATVNDLTKTPVLLANVEGAVKGGSVELKFVTPTGKELTGTGNLNDVTSCSNLKGRLAVKAGGEGVWDLTPAPTDETFTDDLTVNVGDRIRRRVCGRFRGTIVFSDNSSLDCTTGIAVIPDA